MQKINISCIEDILNKRNKLLAESDYTQALDYPISDAKREEWQRYRQALRDLTNQINYPKSVRWPTKPEK
jgi:hypothetical protein